jgi:hypothetical protein
MRNGSYNMKKRENETWKTYNIERMEAQRTSTEKPRHFQKWMKRTEQLDMNENIKNETCSIFF